jgi:chlorobactene glucosyltransferase
MSIFLLYQYIVALILFFLMLNFIINNFLFKDTSVHVLPENFLKKKSLVSVLIPARNEYGNIKRCINSLLRQDYPNLEILVLDDNSTDGTTEIVSELSKKDKRIKLYHGKPLPEGWLGKSFACYQLSEYARGDYLVFVDADTLHFPNSISSSIACLLKYRVDALSVFAKQITVSIHERMTVPFASFMILGFLPLSLIRKAKSALFCTAIGQFMLFKKETYKAIGGHRSVKSEILEDVIISKKVKRAGYRFMIFDGRNNLYCRMYHNFREVIRGYSKVLFPAFDFSISMISAAIVFVTAVYLMPFVMLPLSILFSWPGVFINIITIQIIFIMITRIILAFRFKMKVIDVFLHPLSVIYIISIAVNSLFQFKFATGVNWKGRVYNIFEDEDGEELKTAKDHIE